MPMMTITKSDKETGKRYKVEKFLYILVENRVLGRVLDSSCCIRSSVTPEIVMRISFKSIF